MTVVFDLSINITKGHIGQINVVFARETILATAVLPIQTKRGNHVLDAYKPLLFLLHPLEYVLICTNKDYHRAGCIVMVNCYCCYYK